MSRKFIAIFVGLFLTAAVFGFLLWGTAKMFGGLPPWSTIDSVQRILSGAFYLAYAYVAFAIGFATAEKLAAD